MNAAIHLDFVASAPRSPLAWLCLLAGALLLAGAADRHAEAEARLMQAEQQLSRLQRQHKDVLATASTARGVKDTRNQGQQREQKLLDDAARADWRRALSAVEAAVNKDVAILSLNQEGSGKRLRIMAEARSIDEALQFAERLRSHGKFAEVLLGSHEQHNSTGIGVLGFSLLASW